MALADNATVGAGPTDDWTPPARPAPPKKRGISERLSLGHVVMIAAGLLAFVLVMAVLSDRSATVTVATAEREILPGTTVTADMIAVIEIPADSELVGSVATLESIRVGEVTAGQRIAAGELFIKLHDRLPKEMHAMKDLLASSLWRAPEHWEMNPDHT